MATTIKVLGQSAPNATTETALYTVGAATSAIVSSIVVCNRGSSPATFRISIDVGGGGTGNKDYLYFGLLLPGNDTFVATIGATMSSADVLNVYASTANVSFTAFGTEIT